VSELYADWKLSESVRVLLTLHITGSAPNIAYLYNSIIYAKSPYLVRFSRSFNEIVNLPFLNPVAVPTNPICDVEE